MLECRFCTPIYRLEDTKKSYRKEKEDRHKLRETFIPFEDSRMNRRSIAGEPQYIFDRHKSHSLTF